MEGWVHWTISLSAMRAWSEVHHPRLGGRGSTEHHIRRLGAGHWELRITDLAWYQYNADLLEGASVNEGHVRDNSLKELASRQGGPEWVPFDEETCAALESHYAWFVEVEGARHRS